MDPQSSHSCIHKYYAVFGWLDAPTFRGVERGKPYSLEVGYIKGTDAPGARGLSFRVDIIEGTAGISADSTDTE